MPEQVPPGELVLRYCYEGTAPPPGEQARWAAMICPRPGLHSEARSGSLEPGRPSRARSANKRHPAGRPPTGCTRQTSD